MELQGSDKIANLWDKKVKISYFLAILVFWIHCSSFVNYSVEGTWVNYISIFFQQFFNPIAVPLFLIISGALFFRNYTDKKYIYKLKNRVHSLIIPFVLWNVINMLFDIVASTFFSQYFVGREVFEFSISNIIEGIVHYKYNNPFWFVFALIIFSVAAPVIDKLIYKKWIGVVVIILIAVGAEFGIGLPTPFFYKQSCIVYYLVGAFIGKYYFSNFSKTEATRPMIIISIGVMLLYSLLQVLNLSGNIKISVIVAEIQFVAASLSFWCLFNIICSKVRTRGFMSHSFWVFALHINVSAVITKILWIIMPKQLGFSIVNFVLTTLFTLSLIEFLCFIIKKISSPLYLWLSGNR